MVRERAKTNTELISLIQLDYNCEILCTRSKCHAIYLSVTALRFRDGLKHRWLANRLRAEKPTGQRVALNFASRNIALIYILRLYLFMRCRKTIRVEECCFNSHLAKNGRYSQFFCKTNFPYPYTHHVQNLHSCSSKVYTP